MKTLLLSLIFCVISFEAFAQVQLFIADSTRLSLEGNIFMINEQTNLTNDGLFKADAGRVSFISEADEEIRIEGFGQFVFHELEIDNANTSLQIEDTLQVDSQLIFSKGNLLLNGARVILGENAQVIDENEFNHIQAESGGVLQKTIFINTPDMFSAGNMGFELTSTKELRNTTIIRGHESQEPDVDRSINRYFNFEVEQNENLNAKLRIYYLDSEKNGLSEMDLVIWQNDGSGWVPLCDTEINTTDNWVEIDSLYSLYRYTVAPSDDCDEIEEEQLSIPKSLYAGADLIIDGLEGFPYNEVYILNRWQQLLYQVNPYSNESPWNATHNGKPLAEGTYYIIFKSSDDAAPLKKSIYVLGRN